jgi:7-carboxy-7-deazaguanine synthase
MLPRPTLKIAEIFPSVQGEGTRMGEATIFVRFAGCNLRCSFCDTKSAWKGGTAMTRGEVLAGVREARHGFPAAWVCLTGGEPLLQDISGLVRDLRREGLRIQVETNGTVDRLLPIDWYSVSPKPKNYFCQPRFRKEAKEVKLVASLDLDFDAVRRIRKQFPPEIPVIIQPESNRRASASRAMDILGHCLKDGLANIRLSCQLHKVLKLR